MMDVLRKHQGSCVSIFKALPAREVLHLLCVSRASSWSQRGRWWFMRGVLVVSYIVDVPKIHQGSYISNFISLSAWEVLHLLYVSRVSSWSLKGCWLFLRGVLVVFYIMDVSRIHQGSYMSIFRYFPSWEVLHLLCVHINFQISTVQEIGTTPGFSRASSKCHPWSLGGSWRFLRGVLVVFDIVDVPRS